MQAADAPDNNANLSDSDPNDDDADPADAEILVITSVGTSAGYRVSLNADGALTPDNAILDVWKQTASTYRGTLQVIVKLSKKQSGDVLSLRSGYDASKITPQWDQATGELSLELGSETTTAEIVRALELLELDTEIAGSASTRKVWVFPVLSEVQTGFVIAWTRPQVWCATTCATARDSRFRHASTAASERILFGKKGYLGVPLSNAGKSIYLGLVRVFVWDLRDSTYIWRFRTPPRKASG